MTVLEIMKATEWVSFDRCQDGKLWYVCGKSLDHDDVGYDEFFEFAIPFEDTAGGVFPDVDDKPMHYMRWIRKQQIANQAELDSIAQAKADWYAGKQG